MIDEVWKQSPSLLDYDVSSLDAAVNLCWGSQKQSMNAPGFLDYCSRVCRTKMQGKKPSENAD
jgi:hypothetical protein